MNFSLQNSQSFNSMRQLESLQFEQQPKIPQKENELRANTKAATTENDSFLCQFLARTHPQDLPRQQISFQKHFLDQHIKTIDSILQNSEELISVSLNQINVISEEGENCSNQSLVSDISLLSFLEAHELSRQLADADQLIKDLKKQQDLSELISYFINNYRKGFAIPLVILTADIWSFIRDLNLRYLEIQDLLETAHEWVGDNSSKYLQRPDSSTFILIFKQTTTSHMENSIVQNFANRLTIFTATLMLVVAGFFQNPYADGELHVELLSEVDQPKRQSSWLSLEVGSYSQCFSEEEEEVELKKKRKIE